MNVPQHIVAVTALIRDRQSKVLMVRHPRRGWEPPGGQVEEGESLIEGLQREVQEETGVIASIGALVGVYSNIKPPAKVILCFLGERMAGELRTSSESPEAEWVAQDDVLRRVTHPAIYGRVKDMLEFSGRVVYRVYTIDPYQVHEERFL